MTYYCQKLACECKITCYLKAEVDFITAFLRKVYIVINLHSFFFPLFFLPFFYSLEVYVLCFSPKFFILFYFLISLFIDLLLVVIWWNCAWLIIVLFVMFFIPRAWLETKRLLSISQPAAEIVGFRMGELRGLSRWRARYQGVGLDETLINDATEKAGMLLVQVERFMRVLSSVVQQVCLSEDPCFSIFGNCYWRSNALFFLPYFPPIYFWQNCSQNLWQYK